MTKNNFLYNYADYDHFQKVAKRFLEHYKLSLLPRSVSVTLENPNHLEEIINLTDVLLDARSFNAFALIAIWAKNFFNELSWRYSVIFAMMLRPDTRHMHMPKGYESLPNYFFNTPVIEQLRVLKRESCKSKPIYGQIQLKTGFSAVLEAHSRKFFYKFDIIFLLLINDVP